MNLPDEKVEEIIRLTESEDEYVGNLDDRDPYDDPVQDYSRSVKTDDSEYNGDMTEEEEEEDDFEETEESDDDWGRPVVRKKKPAAQPKRKVYESESESESASGSDFGYSKKKKKKKNFDFISTSDSLRFSNRSKEQKSYTMDITGMEDIFDDEADDKPKKKILTLPEFNEEEGHVIETVVDSKVVMREHEENEEEFPETRFCIKWKGFSHRQNTWHSIDELRYFKGFRKVENYQKRLYEEEAFKNDPQTTPDDIEQMMLQQSLDRELLEEYKIVERVIGSRESTKEDYIGTQFLVKWFRLSYGECTWENADDLSSPEDMAQVDAYLERNSCQTLPHKSVAYIKHRPGYKPFQKQPPYLSKGGELRDYQLLGVNWMAHLWHKDLNGILADEMGLGKTIQSISFLSYLFNSQNVYGPFLVVVPLSTIGAWQREFQKWAPEMNTLCYQGDNLSRQIIRDFEFFQPGSDRLRFNVLLTTFEMILKDKDFLTRIKWAFLAVDEAHRLKNSESQVHESLKDLNTTNRLLITGTPLQNSIKELVALVQFLMPNKFAEFENFELNMEDSEQELKIRELQNQLKDLMLRRLKKDVEKSLPNKTERILRVELSPLQLDYYKAVFTKNFDELRKANQRTSLQNIAMELKKVSNHPFLFSPPEEEMTRDERFRALLNNSGKMVLLDQLLARLKEDGHRVLIFSQMVKMLDLLGEFLSYRGYTFQRLDGTTSSEVRKRGMDQFNAPDSRDFAYLLSTRAGGLGLNLATADTVILFDLDWNPQNDLQAIARAHRIGQKKTVNVYRFLSKGTIEEDIMERGKRKMVLEYSIIKTMDTSGEGIMSRSIKPIGNTVSNEELQAILKFGAQSLFTNAAASGSKLESMNLDDVLARAEVHTGAEETGTALGSTEFLEQFNVSDVAVDQLTWDQIIPEDQRPTKTDSMDEIPEEFLLEGTRRKAATATTSYSETEKKKKAAPKRRSQGPSNKLSEKDLRALVKSLLKYGDIETKYDDIVQEAGLGNKTKTLVKDAVKGILAACEAAIQDEPEIKEEEDKPKTRGSKAKVITANYESLTGINASQLLSRVRDLTFLYIRLADQNLTNFRITWTIKPISNWTCAWSVKDDACLLVGIYKHGFGEWESMQEDDNLPFATKFHLTGDPKLLPKSVQLARRADYVLKLLRENEEKTFERKKQVKDVKEPSKKKRQKTPPETPADTDCESMDEGECKEIMRPVKKELKNLKSPDDSLTGKEKAQWIKDNLYKVGKFISEQTSKKKQEKHLWKFASYFWPTYISSKQYKSIYSKIDEAK